MEPTDRSFHEAVKFAEEAQVDGFVSLGGGSVMDTCKVSEPVIGEAIFHSGLEYDLY